MRHLLLFVPLLLLGCDSPAPPKPVAQPVAKVLSAGDPAPGLKVDKWLHGSPVEMKPGKAYVIDFWAIWCVPCKQAMPHLDALAREYGPQGVEFIALTSRDDQINDLTRVKKYVEEVGVKYAIRFAWCNDDAMVDAWLTAAQRESIPCSFVVDKEGKIAFIGHPSDLDDVLPKVAAGTWRGREDLDAIAEVTARLEGIFSRVDRDGQAAVRKLGESATEEEKKAAFNAAAALAAPKALEEFAAFEKQYPRKAAGNDARAQVMVLRMRVNQHDEAKALAELILAKATTASDVELCDGIRQYWMAKAYNPQRKHLAIAVTAAEFVLSQAPTDVDALIAAAEANKAAGNESRSKTLIEQARRLTENDPGRRAKVDAAVKAFQ